MQRKKGGIGIILVALSKLNTNGAQDKFPFLRHFAYRLEAIT